MRRTKKRRIYIILLVVVVVLSFQVASSLLTERTSLFGKGSLIIDKESSIYEFTYSKESWYSNSRFFYNFSVNLGNESELSVDGWEIIISIPDDTILVSCWNADCWIENNELIIVNESYNRVIPIGGQINFGI